MIPEQSSQKSKNQNNEQTLFRLEEYQPTPYAIPQIELEIQLASRKTVVKAKLHIERRQGTKAGTPLVLDGDGLIMANLLINNTNLDKNAYHADPDRLEFFSPPADKFTLMVETIIDPEANRALMGLYRSNGIFCTQCEAEGFRRITYFYDRPDVLSVYTVHLKADKTECPILLANGNKQKEGDLQNGQHYAIWHDPFPKPSYLFACVGGDLEKIKDCFITQDGRKVTLNIYIEHGKAPRALYAMDSLKRAFAWDEKNFGRIYDLDIFNIVAVSDFNMGAMENKGLNIFNDKYVLADPQTATDADYANIERVIAHEYFHNWTGNRITCRDWFQLCLKEGLTVFRDQEFSSDMRSRPVQRLHDVAFLISQQFTEDAGPLAHPVRPRQYAEINNFYTVTVYEKGAELVRMLPCILGRDGFAKGMDLYFKRHDFGACTIEDFIQCFADSSGRDFSQFMLWYNQAGTPRVKVNCLYDAKTGNLTLELEQNLRPTTTSSAPQPMLIPIRFGFIGRDGKDLAFETDDEAIENSLLLLSKHKQKFHLKLAKNLTVCPVPSLLRNFSAPVILEQSLTEAEKLHLARYDSDPINRYQTLHNLLLTYLQQSIYRTKTDLSPILAAMLELAQNEKLEPAYRALCLDLPSETEIAAAIAENINPETIFTARSTLQKQLAEQGKQVFSALRQNYKTEGSYRPNAAASGKRALRHMAIEYESLAENSPALAAALYAQADNMTERLAGLRILVRYFSQTEETKKVLENFAVRFADNALVMDNWFSLQAGVPGADTLNRVKTLTYHKTFSFDNPNRVRALIGTFAANQTGFNRVDGAAYHYFADVILQIDKQNPQLASRLITAMHSWRQLEAKRRKKIETELQRIAAAKQLSRDSRDIIGRLLAV